MKEWLELLRHLGDAMFDLAAAEAGALAADLRRGGRQAARALVFAAVAAVLAVVAWALLVLAAVWGLATVMDAWLAALVVAAAHAIVAVVCGAVAMRRWRAIEPPAETVRRRWEEQSTWFRERILALPAEQGSIDDATGPARGRIGADAER